MLRQAAGTVPRSPLAGIGVVTVAIATAVRLVAGLAFVLADRAVLAGAVPVLQLPLIGPGDLRPHPRQAKADASLGDDLDQAGAHAALVSREALVEILRPMLE